MIIDRMNSISSKFMCFGYRRIHVILEREGIHINHKRAFRLYEEAGLIFKRRKKKYRYEKRGKPERAGSTPNSRWSLDFVSDVTRTGKRLKIFTLIDESTRECLTLEVDTSITGERVAAYLNKVVLFRGLPKEIQTDSDPKFISNALNAWAYDKKISHVLLIQVVQHRMDT